MISEHIINQDKTILDALNAINAIAKNEALTLFVTDENNVMVGTLTDGDIRRSLVKGIALDTKISSIVHYNYSFLKSANYDVSQIHIARDKGIKLLPILDEDKRIIDVVDLKKQKSCLPIDAVLMAGGKGERLRP